MAEIFVVLIVLPIVFIVILSFIFQSQVSEIQLQQLRLGCPYPINGGTTVPLSVNIEPNNVTITYQIEYDNDTSDYRVTIFKCGNDDLISVETVVYTAETTNSWFDITNRASGYMFYISESITSFFQKVWAGGHLLYLMVEAPAIVTGFAFFSYLNIVLFGFIGLGAFMVIRG